MNEPSFPWGDDIRLNQALLRASGFDPGPLDGRAGPRTLAALRAFLALTEEIRAAHGETYDPNTERRIGTLQPDMQRAARRVLAAARQDSRDVRIASAWRDPAEQARLYAKGRTDPGRIITNAKPWSSWHNYGLAIDLAVIHPRDGYVGDPAPYIAIGRAVMADPELRRTLRWGGDFSSFKDYPHYEWRQPMPPMEYKTKVLGLA